MVNPDEKPLIPSGIGSTPYKVVITWLNNFDLTTESYAEFKRQCDICFKAIDIQSYSSLLFYIKLQLKGPEFEFMEGTEINTWESLKEYLDEHFEIRYNERSLIFELTKITKNPNETLFTFYNRLKTKCVNYIKFIKSHYNDETVIKYRSYHAQKMILEIFIESIGMNLRPFVSYDNPKTIEEAYEILRKVEITTGLKSSHSTEERLSKVLLQLENFDITQDNNSITKTVSINKLTQDDHPFRDDWNATCQFCGRKGHTALKCFDMKREMKKSRRKGYHNNRK